MDEFELDQKHLLIEQAGAWLEIQYVAVSQELSVRALVTSGQGSALWVGGARVQRADLRLVGPAAAALWAVIAQRPPTGHDALEG
jgi:hypothetical protein